MSRLFTFISTLSLIFAVAFSVVDAHLDSHFPRDHVPAARRMIKARGALSLLGVNNAADPPLVGAAANPSVSPSPTATDTTPGNVQTHTDPPSASASKPLLGGLLPPLSPNPVSTTASAVTTSDGGLLPSILPIIGGGSSANGTNATSSTTSTSSSSSVITTTSSTPTSTSTSSTPSDTSTTDVVSSGPVAITVTSSLSPSPTSSPSTSSGSVTKIQRNTIIILIAIGASIGAAGIIWTIIRKWKFKPSRSLEDRMQPIDWQPTTGPHDDRDITEKINRSPSVRSHGSFTSGNNHDHLNVDLPQHDFTAGPSHLAPVGGYVDLQRGPSPQPDIQRGPSFRTPNPYQYEIPNPHGQQYYNGAGVGTYQDGYGHGRGY